jgi:hypothetical protein
MRVGKVKCCAAPGAARSTLPSPDVSGLAKQVAEFPRAYLTRLRFERARRVGPRESGRRGGAEPEGSGPEHRAQFLAEQRARERERQG